MQPNHPTRSILTLRGALFAALLVFAGLNAAAETPDGDFALNLTDADIGVFIQTVSEITGQNFVIDPRVKGKVTVITATPTSADRIYEIFLSVLQVNGFVAIPTGDVVKIVPDAGAAQLAAGSDVTLGSDALVTRIIEVEHVSVRQMAQTLRPLLPPTAFVSSHPEAKMIVVADSAANVDRIARIIARIDTGSSQDTEIVPLRHSDAGNLVDTINALQQQYAAKTQSLSGDIAAMVADARANAIVLSGKPSERARVRALIRRLDVPTDRVRGARVLFLKHAVAADLQKVLKNIGGKLLQTESKRSQQFEIEADEATNALILSAPPDLMAVIQAVIDKLDVPRSQVQVEGIIAELSTDRTAELGLQWRTSIPTDGVGAVLRSPLTGSTASTLPGGAGGTGGFPGNYGTGISLGYFSGGDLRALLTALAGDTESKILSTPTVVTLDNKKALIHVGQNVPIVTGTFTNDSGAQDPFQTIERRDVGVKLEVTPQINEGNTVRLEIRQEVSSVAPGTSADGLITNERTIETTVQVENGEIIALGGLISDDVSEQKSSVPYLGEVPLLGELFTSRRSVLSRKNLVVFLRPTILGGGRGGGMTETRYRELRELQLDGRDHGKDITHIPGERAATLPPYPPPANQSVISLPKKAPAAAESKTPSGALAHDTEFEETYSFFDL